MDPGLIGTLVGAILFGSISAAVASGKNRSVAGGFFTGFFLGPAGLIITICRKRVEGTVSSIQETKDITDVSRREKGFVEKSMRRSLSCLDENMLVAKEAGNYPKAIRFIERGADPNLHRGYGTLLHAAVGLKSIDWVKMLIEHHADPNIKNNEGNTALLLAIQKASPVDKNKYEIFRTIANLLLNHGADPNISNYSGDVALSEAQPDVELTKLLLKHKADPNIKDGRGYTPLCWHVSQLFQAWIRNEDLPEEYYGQLIECMKLLLEHGADPNIKYDGMSAVGMARAYYKQYQKADLAALFAKHNADFH